MSDHGHFVWNELMTADVEAAKAFYGKVAGWTFEEVEGAEPPYTLCFPAGDDVPVAGIMHWPDDQPGGRDWFTYMAVASIAKSMTEVQAAGGTVIREPFEVPDTGTIAIVKDNGGVVLGLLEPLPD